MRFALGVDDDLTEFARAFRGDPLIGEAIHHRPWLRPRRRPWPWEALAWAVTEQLIELRRAVEIQRRIVRQHVGAVVAHDAPGLEHIAAIRHREGERRHLVDQQDGDAVVAQFRQHVEQFVDHRRR